MKKLEEIQDESDISPSSDINSDELTDSDEFNDVDMCQILSGQTITMMPVF